MTEKDIIELKLKANKVRELIISSLVTAASGHSAGPLGMADIFTAMYFHLLHHDPKNPEWADRDRLILSNGHICPVRYATMALVGYFPIEELQTLRKINSRIQGHPHRTVLPGLETTSGPLGEGLSQSVGIALAGKLDRKDYFVYCLTSDGEHQEGQTWEAAMMAGKYKLSHLIQIIDRNKIQIDGSTEEVMPLEPFKEKYASFNWNTLEIDGNDMEQIIEAVEKAKQFTNGPTIIIANTVPGKGVDFMENDYTWHGKPPNKDEAEKALAQLHETEEKLHNKVNSLV
ncbi:MAG: transketolase [Patescibacteria group bacterium]|nr:transketolase [Patescibacteria group bacterium]MDE2589602.1 transketolase [Patescibacteria group bacterium]